MVPVNAIIKGSYNPDDVTFLLKPVVLPPTDTTTKERLIQSGAAHYSEMISEERRPDEKYLSLFENARQSSNRRIASEIAALARCIAEKMKQGALAERITLCSLVRAGVPYGVLLQRELSAHTIDTVHYGVSIIRDKGLDRNAMEFILRQRPQNGVIFVDGWTGKGAIANELERSWKEITGVTAPMLVVLADPGGFATLSGSHEDWLIPSGILGANVSGLISRSILNKDCVGPGDFHGSVPVRHLADIDISLDFVDQITQLIPVERSNSSRSATPVKHRGELRTKALESIDRIARQFNVRNYNRIKPGIAEATRAVLRRKPERVFIRSFDDPDLAALVHLCQSDNVELLEDASLTGPYRAITLISQVGG